MSDESKVCWLCKAPTGDSDYCARCDDNDWVEDEPDEDAEAADDDRYVTVCSLCEGEASQDGYCRHCDDPYVLDYRGPYEDEDEDDEDE